MKSAHAVTFVVLSLAAGPAAAQSPQPIATTMAPLPPLGLPLPPIGLPLPAIGLTGGPASPAAVGRSGRIATVGHPPRRGAVRVSRHSVLSPALVVMPIVVVNTAVSPAMVVESAPPAQARGRLQVHAEPRDAARIYVDGFFAGSGSNEGSVFELEEGLHTIEVRADGFQDVSELVLVTAAGSVTHKVSLKAAPQPPPRSGPVTFYVVPGCYAGDVPPDRAALPASCGPARAVTVAP